jgi:hypothetical protein
MSRGDTSGDALQAGHLGRGIHDSNRTALLAKHAQCDALLAIVHLDQTLWRLYIDILNLLSRRDFSDQKRELLEP